MPRLRCRRAAPLDVTRWCVSTYINLILSLDSSRFYPIIRAYNHHPHWRNDMDEENDDLYYGDDDWDSLDDMAGDWESEETWGSQEDEEDCEDGDEWYKHQDVPFPEEGDAF